MDIRFFRLDEIEVLKSAIDVLWSKNHILSRDEELLKYMFHSNPNTNLIVKDGHFSFLGAWEGKEVIGLLGIMPFQFNQVGKKGLGCCLTNWIVAPEHRASGAGLALINFVQNLNPDMILSLGVSADGSKIYKLMRWNVQEDTPRWIGVLNKGKTAQIMLNGDTTSLRYWKEVEPYEVSTSYKCDILDDLNEASWNDFYWGSFAKKSIGIARNYLFLKWRYFEHPTFDYKVIACSENSIYKGLAVVRIEQIEGGYKLGRIVEFMATDQDSAVSLSNKIIQLDPKILFFDFYCFSSISSWGLESVGFKRILKSSNDKFVVPSRFQPIDLENTQMISAIYLSEKLRNKVNPMLDQLWYVTKSDSDQDRPN
ncbi:hypothetical protein [Psychrobacillus sp. NPDC096623]|uniref:hypothetical protein n=1 Tax=Psychrobacillus sp. NPDC096623 TaxID=3364492 RepID=UPI00382EA6F3